MPVSSLSTVPPVSAAMSCSIALRRSPKPGAFTAQHFSTPRIWLTISVASASPSTSSATTSSGRPAFTIWSSSGRKSARLPILRSASSTKTSSSTASIFSGAVMK